MKNKLTSALLFAGLFLSLKTHAAGECLSYSGSIVQFLNFEGSGCPPIASVTHGSSQCELVRTSDFICVVTNTNGGAQGGPWRYSGNLLDGQTDPDPDDPTNPIYTELNPISFFGFSADCQATDQTCRPLSNQVLFNFQNLSIQLSKLSKNDNVINTNVVTLSDKINNLSTYVNAAKSSSESAKNSADSTKQAVNALDQKATETLTKVIESNTTLTELKTLTEDIRETNALDALDNKQLHQQTHDSQTEAKNSLDAITSKLPLLDSINLRAGLASDYSSEANYNAQQATFAANDAASIGVMAYQAANSAMDNTNAIYSMVYEMYEGETGSPGQDPDMAETNEILNALKFDVNTNTDRIIDAISPFETQLADINSNLGWISEHVGQQLDGIKTAVENIDIGGGSGGPSTDTGTHERLDTLNTKVSELNENVVDSALNTQQVIEGSTDELLAKLVAIKDALENGSSEYDDTEINEKLTALINNTGSTGNNVVTSGQATQQAVAASGQQVADAVNGLGEKLDGISQTIEGMGNAFEPGSGQNSGPTLCTGDDCYKGKSWISPKYPDGITSIYDDHKEKFKDSAINDYLKGFVPTLNGNAPASWELCFNFDRLANFGCYNAELPPYVISFVRLIILITAGFLCRRLIFGG